MGDSWRDAVKKKQQNLGAVARFKANDPKSWAEDRTESDRKQKQHEVLQKRSKRARTTAQLRMWLDAR